MKLMVSRVGWRAFALAAAVFVAGCGGSDIEEPELVRPAKLFTVKAASDQLDASFPAIVEARNSSTLTFQVGGLLTHFPVSESQFVRQGQVLARLDQRRFANAVASAKAQYDVAQRDYESAAALLEENAIAEIQVRQRAAQRDVAAANLDSARKDLADTVIRAPFSGVVAQKLAVRYENVAAQQDIVTLQSTGSAEAVVNVPSRLVARFAGRRATNEYITLSSAPDIQIPGRFLAARTQADTESQTFRVKFAFNPPPSVTVLPGMTATVYVSRDLVEDELPGDGIAVPLGAVQSDGKQRFVWIVDREDMTVSRRAVTIADSIGEEVLVSKGLKAGETIVAAGAAYLHDGMKIRPYES
ncbi:efflux RND transporter periplasmic adaptor subunit [Qipengyuania flava]|uniref:efflux RND transporter periplasmic adaptor subunit n=1 Tax=Qipengyuania flava TaxID=192812 RepID=UPI001C62F2C0|nr:efflux RND transporter periplasmic adaptor subunit [Qipengyuania flava]QYJ08331.1 efflux RND transporter periplasmic adaptor subunit [Qipengyuania flava]